MGALVSEYKGRRHIRSDGNRQSKTLRYMFSLFSGLSVDYVICKACEVLDFFGLFKFIIQYMCCKQKLSFKRSKCGTVPITLDTLPLRAEDHLTSHLTFLLHMF